MQTDWVNRILSHFDDSQRFILVTDADGLLGEESVLREIAERGYELIEYQDAVLARYLYEQQWRSRLRRGEKLMLYSPDPSRSSRMTLSRPQIFPYDWLSQAQTVSLKLTDILPNLSYPVLLRLPRSYLPALLEPSQHLYQPLGDEETRRFVLKYALEFAPEAIVSTAGLIHQLILLYVRHPSIPEELLESVASDPSLRSRACPECNEGMTLLARLGQPDILFAGKAPFFNYLQGEWERYVESGESEVPFEDVAVRYLMPNLFAEGLLQRLEGSRSVPSWASVGTVKTDQSTAERLSTQLEEIALQIPPPNTRHTQWRTFAMRWGEATAQVLRSAPSADIDRRFKNLRETIDTCFWDWLKPHYGLLLSLSSVPTPVTVHKVAPYLASRQGAKKALLVLDGFSMVAWQLLRSEWLKGGVGFDWTESAIFAMIPTITSISRQSIFAGKLPSAFPKHLDSTYHEPNHWQRFWGDGPKVAYDKGKLREIQKRLSETTANFQIPVVGFVINDVDDIADAEVQGLFGLAASLKHWAETEHLDTLINQLLQEDYHVVLTSDHGQTCAKGIGTLREGLTVESTCRRARLYASEALRPAHPNAHPWRGYGLPNELFPLLSAGYTAFATEGREIVTHGGAAIEEVIVPFIVFEGENYEKHE
jgi:hypothetical protein